MAGKHWFDEKSEQVSPGTLTAFGIRIESRYGNAEELVEMLEFCADAAMQELERHIESIFYDSKAGVCAFEPAGGLKPSASAAARLLQIAQNRISQFTWIDDELYHGRGVEEP